ncbi:uncharacterized protein C8Q71DRAFT_728329 [Rhodofomes roseus]|uniref:Uncharacterized protein n=1 Tax=Rhodofomes roseus TaxID=34475 RepID=A0ABQ8JXQ8_9APHY|nr:uncharacterized protein C8Q71DRAFT_728329 [Rhodofomes roseus]KAH9829006.1 hypothetical protein C8Q71DRAFT_728329 [Rhodofomes roseus]
MSQRSRQQSNSAPDEPPRRERHPSAKQRQLDKDQEAAQSRKGQKRPADESSENRASGAKPGKKPRTSHSGNNGNSTSTVTQSPHKFTTQSVTSAKPNNVPFKNLIKRKEKVLHKVTQAQQSARHSEPSAPAPLPPPTVRLSVPQHSKQPPPSRPQAVARHSESSSSLPSRLIARRSGTPPPATLKRYGTANQSEQRQDQRNVQVASTARQVFSGSNTTQSRSTGEPQSQSNTRRPGNAGRVPPLSDDEEMAPEDHRRRGPKADSPEPLGRDNDKGSDIGNGFYNDLEYDDDQSGNKHHVNPYVYDAADFQDDEEYFSQQDDDQPVERVPSSPHSSSPPPHQGVSPHDDVDDDDQEQQREVLEDKEDDEGSGDEGSSMNGEVIGTPSKHGPRVKDYNADVKALLNIANSLYRCRVSTINAFPTDLLEEEWAQICWGEACKTLNVNYAADQHVIKIVSH